MSESQPRPRHTSFAGGLVIGAAVGVVVAVGEQLAGINSLDTREQITEFLSRPPGSDLSISVPTALSTLRVVLMVLAGCATAAAVLGWHSLQGSTRARLALSILAVPIFIGGAATGGFLTSLVAAGTTLLWIGPSGMWFRGEPIPDPAREQRRESPDAPSPFHTPPPGPPQPPPTDQPGTSLQATRPAAPADSHSDRDHRVAVPQRPDALVWACVLTWAFCGLALVVMSASAALMASSPDLILDELRRQDGDLAGEVMTADSLTTTTYLTAAVAAAWSLVAIALAVLAYRGLGWARGALLGSAALAGVVCLLGALYSPLLVVPAVAILVTVVLLTRPEVRDWFARTRPHS